MIDINLIIIFVWESVKRKRKLSCFVTTDFLNFSFSQYFQVLQEFYLIFFYSILCFMNVKRVDLNVKYYFLNVKNRRTVLYVVYTIYAQTSILYLSIYLSSLRLSIYLNLQPSLLKSNTYIVTNSSWNISVQLADNVKLQYSTVQSLIDKWNWLEFCHEKKEKKK